MTRPPIEPPQPGQEGCSNGEFRFSAGPYLLGALAADDRQAFERHLAGCPECRAQVDRLRPVVDLLGSVATSDADLLLEEVGGPHPAPAQPLPDTLLVGLLARAARQRRRRALIATAGVVAAAAIIALLAVFATGPAAPAPQATGQVVTMTTQHGGAVSATATVTEMPWGTQIVLHCRYPATPPGSGAGYGPTSPTAVPVFTLRVTDTSGAAHQLGSWTLAAGKDAVFTAGTAIPPDRIGLIEVLRSDGTAVLTARG